jgi:glycosyltransferase involved in cell wall biosynthesis
MTTTRARITYIIPAYNCADTIRETVASVFDGNFLTGDEIILIDDCSTDNTPGILREIEESRGAVRVLRHNHNRGTAAAGRNTGIDQATNDLLFCLDSDNILAPGSVTGLCEHLRTADADAAAFGEIQYFRKTTRRVTHKWIHKDTITLADALAGFVWPGPSGNYLFTRESWIRAGRYHEPYLENRSLDSWTFGIRQLGTGSRMVSLAGTWYYHRYGHKSHYVQNWQRGSQSLAALIGLIPFLEQLDQGDVEYILSPEARDSWYEGLSQHPLRLKAGSRGEDGRIEYLPLYRREQRRHFAAALIGKVRAHLKGGGA